VITPHREALEALFGIVKMRDSWTTDVDARVSILNHEDPVMDRSKTVRYGREIPYRNTRALSPVKQPGPH
jgi:hypothetical protein